MPGKKPPKVVRKTAAERLERLKGQKEFPTTANKEAWELGKLSGSKRKRGY